jgi:hypothetical protein
VGEILTMTGTYGVSTWTALISATGVILSAVYALNLYRAVIFGTVTNPKLESIADLDWREVAIFAPADRLDPRARGLSERRFQPDPVLGRPPRVGLYQAAIGG